MVHKLDLKDKKLLYELDLNSRQTFSELSKKLKLSKSSVIHRISNLQKEGIVKQFHAAVDIGKLGYISFRLYLKLQNASLEKEQEIINFLKQKEIVIWIVSIEDSYNIGAVILTKSIQEMNSLWKELLDKYLNYIQERELTVVTKTTYFSRAYLLDKEINDYEITFITEPEEIYLSEIDKKILKLLAPNARMKIIDIAEKLKITPKTVINKIKKLEKEKVIIGYRTVFDLEKIGYLYFKIHFSFLNVVKEKKRELDIFIKTHPNIIYDNEVLGGDDLEIEIQVKNIEELRQIIEQIRSKFSDIIKDYKIMQYYKEHKYLFLPVRI